MAVPIFPDTPWLGEEHDGYPRVPFDEYLEINRVRRWPEDRPKIFRDATGPAYLIRELAQLQCQVTFGLLEAVMEVKIPESKLLRRNSSGEQVLTCENLLDLFLDFRSRAQKLRGDDSTPIPDAYWEWVRRIQATYAQLDNVISMDSIVKVKVSGFWPAGLEPHVLVDIIIQMGSLMSALSFSTWEAFNTEAGLNTFPGSNVMFYLSDEQLRSTMLQSGWCPVIAGDFTRARPCVLGYARTLESPHCRRSEGHEKCTQRSCEVNTRGSDGNLPPKHVSEDCNCNDIMPLLEEVKHLLQDRKIPVVEYFSPDVLTVKDSSNTPFVAISHVWGDGLRGTTEKGLPGCQIERIAKMASEILNCTDSFTDRAGGGSAFWIDTICIPEIDDLRHRAIGLMGKTYKDAEAVLVIDSGIREISSSGPREERLFHVVSSRWMQRLWTFQEGALAKKLYFEFADSRLVSLDDLAPSFERFTVADFLIPVLSSLVEDVRRDMEGEVVDFAANFVATDERGGFDLDTLAHILRKRSTSDKDDETLAVCGVMNLDGLELARISDPQERMATFLLRVEKLPSDVLFEGDLKLYKPGFRWAPKTIMGNALPLSMSWKSDTALCTSTGLEAEYDALTLGVVFGGEKEDRYLCYLFEGSMCICEVLSPPGYRSVTPYYNTILVRKGFPRPDEYDMKGCAGVWVNPEPVEEGSNGGRILCEFRTLGFLHPLRDHLGDMERSHTTLTVKPVRKMRVKVV